MSEKRVWEEAKRFADDGGGGGDDSGGGGGGGGGDDGDPSGPAAGYKRWKALKEANAREETMGCGYDPSKPED